MVQAAERCPAGIIHPGDPLNPKEKDLEKWVKRAEPFNHFILTTIHGTRRTHQAIDSEGRVFDTYEAKSEERKANR